MSSSLLPAAGEQNRAAGVAPVSLERVNKRKVRLAIPHPTQTDAPQCSRFLATFLNGVNQKLLFLRTPFQHMIQVCVPIYLVAALHSETTARKSRSSYVCFIVWNRMSLCYSP